MLIVPTEKRFDWRHAPVTLFFLVLANCMIFFLYQVGDGAKLYQAMELYERNGYLKIESPLFEEYLAANDESDALEDYRRLREREAYAEQIFFILSREDFYEYLDANRHQLLSYQQIERWTGPRNNIQRVFQSVSYLKFGLIPDRLNPLTLISHQFLHGDAMHLLGNMFFLIVCGFAVEAAIGHLRFLAFYLVSGIAGGALYSVMDLSSQTPLVGASGAISGVMAMYVAAFRLKKIEFFYWFFVFVGYFRAPALMILPFYIGKELYDYYVNTGSNVAYMAHVGGFLGGAALIGAALLLNPRIFNEEYIEEDQTLDPAQEKLANIYALIEKFRFKAALSALNAFIEEYGSSFELEKMRYHLMRPGRPSGYGECVRTLLKMRPGNERELNLLNDIWVANPELHAALDEDSRLKLALNLTTPEHWSTAEGIFQELHGNRCRHMSLGVLARKLSVCFETMGDRAKKSEYAQLADSLLAGGF